MPVKLIPKLSYGGGLPDDTLQRQQQNAATSQQVGGMVQQALPLLSSAGSAAGASGAMAGLAGAAGPIGLGLAAGSMINGIIGKSTKDANGFNKTGTGASVARAFGDSVDPITHLTTAFGNLGRGDLTGGEKALSFIPGIGALATDRADKAREEEMMRKKAQQAINQNEASIYGGVPVAREGIKLVPKPAPPARTGNYAAGTTAQLQGASSNKTLQYLQGVDPHDPGQQNFWREAITDVPHPLEPGKTMNYGQLQDYLGGPNGKAALEAYGRSANLPTQPTREQYAQAMFDQGKQRFMQRASAEPGKYAFPAQADAARRDPTTTHLIAHGNYLPSDNPQQVTNPAMQQQRLGDIEPGQGSYSAPGIALLPRQAAAPATPQVRPRTPQTVVKRAEGGPIQLQPRKPVPAAESTGMARPQLPTPVLNTEQIPKPGARQYFQQTASGVPQLDHLRLQQYLHNGAPEIVQDTTNQRASFQSWNNSMTLNPKTNYQQDYTSELAHAQQLKTMGKKAYQQKAVEGLKYADSTPENPHGGRYGIPGQIEHDAHSIIEPALQQENTRMYRKAHYQQRAFEALGQQQGLTVVNGLVAKSTRDDNKPYQAPQPAVRGSFQQVALKPRKLAGGGSLIASGALHSEKHGLEGAGLGKTGIPIVSAHTGERAAEIERNELVLGDDATTRLENLRDRHKRGDKLAAGMAGKLLKVELKERTTPNERYTKRLGEKPVQEYQGGGNLTILGKDGKPYAGFAGHNRVMSQSHTRELVTKALGAKHGGHERALGLRAFSMLTHQDKRPTEYAKD